MINKMKPSIHSKYSNENPPYLDDHWEYFPSIETDYFDTWFSEMLKKIPDKNISNPNKEN